MALTFYYGAGSPYAWRVWLALEHKLIPYERKVLSFSAGDLKQPDFLALNPRGRVPVVVDGALPLYESAAIVEYLEDAYPDYGKRLFPGSVTDRAVIRRLICEADNYLAPAGNRLLRLVLFTKEEEWNAERITVARDDLVAELKRWGPAIRGDYLAGPVSAADYTVYPMIALGLRCEKKKPDLALRAAIPERLNAWMQGVEMLPYFSRTWPAHWK
ncbi:MAG: glutathione S-transferase family protein [Burkholderiales bacterium]